jgi:DNA adenine methylase
VGHFKEENMTIISAPIRYAGSKAMLMPKLLDLLPAHTRYVSVFGGSGADILNKPMSKYETWNDLDGHLFNLFSVLKHPMQRKELVGLICMTTYSRREFTEAQKVLHDPNTDAVQRAWATVVTGNQMLAGVHFTRKLASQWAYFRLPSHTLRWPRLPHILVQVANRFRNVVIENLSWEAVLDKYDCSTTLFYLDPPYVHSTRFSVGDQYAHEMSDADHKRLLDRLQVVEGRVMLSGYDHSFYNESLAHWKRYEFAAVCSMSSAKKKPKRTEVLWTNYICKGVQK